jgi:type I restriction enzyme R subunit
MHGQIRKHFEKSKFIGFTGTPIYAINKGANGQTTDYVFAPTDNYNPLTTGKTIPASCIHKYMIKDAIADGNVLRFSVEYMRSVALKNLKNLSIDANLIDDAEYCRLHNIDLEELYHSDERIASISDDILGHLCQHTRLNNNNVYTAIFAIDRIEILMKYYNKIRIDLHKLIMLH